MTMYLFLLMCTAASAVIVVWIYRSIARWRMSDVRVVSLSNGSLPYGTRRQKGFIRNERRADGTVAWTLKGKKSPTKSGRKQSQKASRNTQSGDKTIRKPWGW